MNTFFQKALKTGWSIVALILLAALGIYAWIGASMRYLGDDYCYGMILTQMGFWPAQWHSYLMPTPYTGDRFSLTFFSDFFHLLGPQFSGWLPGLMLIAWLFALVMVFWQASRMLQLKRNAPLWVGGSAGFVFLVLYQAPDLQESFYWRSGMLPYFMPLIGDTWLVAWLLASIQKGRAMWSEMAGIALLAFINSGFSETAVALQAGALGLALILLWAFGRKKVQYAQSWRPIACALLGTGLAMVVMLLSPSNANRLATYPKPLGFFPAVGFSIQYAWDFVRESIRGLPVPTIVGMLFTMALGFELSQKQPIMKKMHGWQCLLVISVIIIFGFLLVVCSVAPSVFIQTVYPEPRALMVSRFAMESTILMLGGFIGWCVFDRITREPFLHLMRVAAIIVVIACVAYAIRGAARPLKDLPGYRQYAVQWDSRDAQIRRDRLKGVRDISVMPLTHMLARGGEISSDAGHWYNRCIAGYYGVDSIRALPD